MVQKNPPIRRDVWLRFPPAHRTKDASQGTTRRAVACVETNCHAWRNAILAKRKCDRAWFTEDRLHGTKMPSLMNRHGVGGRRMVRASRWHRSDPRRVKVPCILRATRNECGAIYGSKKRRLAHPRWTRVEGRGSFHDSIPMGSSTFVDSASQASTSMTSNNVLPPDSMCNHVQGIYPLVRGCVLLPNVPTSNTRPFAIVAWYLPSIPRFHAFHGIPSFPVAAPPSSPRASVVGSAWTSIARGWWCLGMAHVPRACRFVDPPEQQMPSVSPSSFLERQQQMGRNSECLPASPPFLLLSFPREKGAPVPFERNRPKGKIFPIENASRYIFLEFEGRTCQWWWTTRIVAHDAHRHEAAGATRAAEDDPVRPRRLLSRQLLYAEEGRKEEPNRAAMAAKIAKKDSFREQMCVITHAATCETRRWKETS